MQQFAREREQDGSLNRPLGAKELSITLKLLRPCLGVGGFVGGGFVVDDPANAITHKRAVDDVDGATFGRGCGLRPFAAGVWVWAEHPLTVLALAGSEEVLQHSGCRGLRSGCGVTLLHEPVLHSRQASLQAGDGPCRQTVMVFDLGVYLAVWGALAGYAMSLLSLGENEEGGHATEEGKA